MITYLSVAECESIFKEARKKEVIEKKSKAYNDEERRLWLDNDEGLYDWWRYSRLSKREFIKVHREEIDEHIKAVLDRKPE